MPDACVARLEALYRRRAAVVEVITALEEYQRAAETGRAARLVFAQYTTCRERTAVPPARIRRTSRASIARH